MWKSLEGKGKPSYVCSVRMNERLKHYTMRRTQRTQQLKNTTSYGAELKQMNNDVYALRRRVINAIYELKKHVDLPRIEVRIVKMGKDTCGYAYLRENVVHINEHYTKTFNDDALLHLVAHEVVHAVAGFEHDEKCYLMKPTIPRSADKKRTMKAFLKYFN